MLIKPLISLYPVRPWSFAPLALLEGLAALVNWTPGDVEIERTEIAGVPVERIVPVGGTQRADSAICYFHGGAFLACGPATHRRVASVLARLLGVTVYNVGYRQLPAVGMATSVEDGYRVYCAVSASGRYRKVAVGGDSAGGYIAAKVVELTHIDGSRQPAAYFGFSPLLNPTVVDDDPRFAINDAYLTVGKLRGLREYFDRGPVSPRGADDATVIDPVAFPPAMVVSCSQEMLRIDAERLHEALTSAGARCDLHLFDGGVHAFPVLAGATPESALAIKATVDFLSELFGEAAVRRAA